MSFSDPDQYRTTESISKYTFGETSATSTISQRNGISTSRLQEPTTTKDSGELSSPEIHEITTTGVQRNIISTSGLQEPTTTKDSSELSSPEIHEITTTGVQRNGLSTSGLQEPPTTKDSSEMSSPDQITTIGVAIKTSPTPQWSCSACVCHNNTYSLYIEDPVLRAEVEEKLNEIRSVLTINKTELSSHRRTKISVSDQRMVCRVVGGLAVIVLCFCCAVIVVPDITMLFNYVFQRRS